MNRILLFLSLLLPSLALASGGSTGNAVALQGKAISTTAPTNSQCLVYNAILAKWAPGSCAAGGTGITSINADTTSDQLLVVGTAGTDFAIVDDLAGTHTFNLPDASATARGVMSTSAQTIAGAKTFSSAPTMSALSASLPVCTDGSKGLTSTCPTVTIAKGGTNSTAALNNNRVMQSSGGAIVEAAAITAAKALCSDANGIPVACASGPSTTTMAFVDPTSSIQTQLNSKAALASPTFTGTVALPAATLSGDLSKGNCYVSPKESDLGNSGASLAIDLGTATTFTITLNNSTPTLTFSNPVAGCAYAIILTQGSGGSKVPTWAGTTNIWGNSGSKTLSTAAAAVDKVTCVYNGSITSLMCDLGNAYQ